MAVIDTTERAPAVTEKTASAPPGHYRAAVVHEFSSRLTIDEIPRPVLEPGQILVEVEATGLCHTDIHAAHGDWPVKPSPPFVPGHEGIGIVRELGAGVTEVALGDRVAMPWLGYACRTCVQTNLIAGVLAATVAAGAGLARLGGRLLRRPSAAR